MALFLQRRAEITGFADDHASAALVLQRRGRRIRVHVFLDRPAAGGERLANRVPDLGPLAVISDVLNAVKRQTCKSGVR
jgi:hypothetical protein